MKKSKINFFLILLLACILPLSSCKKPFGKTTIDVLVKNPITDEVYEGVHAEVSSLVKGAIVGSYMNIDAREETDKNGRAFIEFKAKRNKHKNYKFSLDYIPDFDEEDYVYIPHVWLNNNGPIFTSYEKNISKHIHNDFVGELVFLANLNARFINENCTGIEDTLFYGIQHTKITRNDAGSKFPKYGTIIGCADMYFDSELMHGGPQDFQGWYKATWEVHRNGEIITGVDSVYLEPGGTETIEIRY